MPPNRLVTRRLLGVAESRLQEGPVVLLQGPRTVGKSSLLSALVGRCGGEVIDLDDPPTREAVAADPTTFVRAPSPVFIDEYQHVPEVLAAVKAELNKDLRPGRFVLAGSTRYDALPEAAQSLTGRLHRLEVLPFSQGELDREADRLLVALLRDPAAVVDGRRSSTTREDYIERIVRGGFPLAVARSTSGARSRWIDDYVALTLERDVPELSNIRRAAMMPRFLQRLASQTAQVLNIAAASTETGFDRDTGESYARLLESVFLIHRLPPWGTTLRARTLRSPKVHVVDSGVAARLMRLTSERLAQRDPSALAELGHLLETFVIGEIRKQASWLDGVAGLGHWRTYDGLEVDMVVERDDGAVAAFEVKAAAQLRPKDLKPLEALREAVGDRFLAGVGLYLGERSYTHADRVHVLPVDRLWVG